MFAAAADGGGRLFYLLVSQPSSELWPGEFYMYLDGPRFMCKVSPLKPLAIKASCTALHTIEFVWLVAFFFLLQRFFASVAVSVPG